MAQPARATARRSSRLHTYRIEAHTNADDATRYRDDAEVAAWRAHDPIARLEAYLRGARACSTTTAVAAVAAEAEALAADLRDRMNADVERRPVDLFDHVYAEPTPQLREQAAQLRAELEAEADSADDARPRMSR